MIRGEIWWADFGLPFGSECGFKRPVVVIQNDAFNESSINTVLVVPLTTNLLLAEAPGNVLLKGSETKLSKDSTAVVSQLTALDKRRLRERESKVSRKIIAEIESGILLALGIE